MAVVVVVVEPAFAVATCPMETAAGGIVGVEKESDFEARETVLDGVAITTSSDTSGDSGRGNEMLGEGAVPAAIRASIWDCRRCMNTTSKTKTIPATARLKTKPTRGVTHRSVLPG